MFTKGYQESIGHSIKKYNLIKNVTYIFFIFSLLVGCREHDTRQLPILNETYKKTDKKPFGSYVAYNHFNALFNDAFVEAILKPFDETWKDIKNYSSNTQYSLYFLVAKNIELTKKEANA